MTPTIEELEAKIRAAVKKAQQEGWRVEAGCWVHSMGICCPLGATVLEKIPTYPAEQDELTAHAIRTLVIKELGVSAAWTRGFVEGFDGIQGHQRWDPSAYKLGRKFRKELC